MILSGYIKLMRDVNTLIDSNEYEHISIDDVYSAIEEGRLLTFLNDNTIDTVDISELYDTSKYGDFVKQFDKSVKKFYEKYYQKEESLFGVKNYGLCLLMAWTLAILKDDSSIFQK